MKAREVPPLRLTAEELCDLRAFHNEIERLPLGSKARIALLEGAHSRFMRFTKRKRGRGRPIALIDPDANPLFFMMTTSMDTGITNVRELARRAIKKYKIKGEPDALIQRLERKYAKRVTIRPDGKLSLSIGGRP